MRDHSRIGQRGSIPQHSSLSNVAQQAAHDFGTARLGQFSGEKDVIGPCNGSDLLDDMLLKLVFEGLAWYNSLLQSNKAGDALPLELMRPSDHGSFRHGGVIHEGALNLVG